MGELGSTPSFRCWSRLTVTKMGGSPGKNSMINWGTLLRRRLRHRETWSWPLRLKSKMRRPAKACVVEASRTNMLLSSVLQTVKAQLANAQLNQVRHDFL